MKSKLAAAVLSVVLGAMALTAGESRAAPKPIGPPPLKAVPAPPPVPPAIALGPEFCSDKLTLAGFVPASVATRVAPEFTDSDAGAESEGWVRVGFTIATDGETKDVVVLDQVGTPNMAKSARTAVARWRYKPATQDGTPVEQYANAVDLLFRAKHVGNAPIHDAVVSKYNDGRALVAAGKYADGIAVLEQSFDLPFTLYEQAKVSFALAFAYEKTNNLPRALAHIRHAMIEKGTFLERTVVPAAQRLRLRLEVANGNYRYAACAAPLAASDEFDPTGADRAATVKVVEEVKKKLTLPQPLAIDATLTAKVAGGDGGLWEHPMARRKFKFMSVRGTVQDLRLSCTRQLTQALVDETAQWNIPPSAGPCTLRITGDIGATLRLIEE